MEHRPPADNALPHFLTMMVRAPRAVDLLANSPGAPQRPFSNCGGYPQPRQSGAARMPGGVNKWPTLNSPAVSKVAKNPIVG